MKNYVQDGRVVTLAAPADVSSGDGMLVGKLFGVAQLDAKKDADVPAVLEGVVTLPKATDAITQGAKVYWDNTNKNVTTTATSNTLIGAATVAAASADTSVVVRLNGTV